MLDFVPARKIRDIEDEGLALIAFSGGPIRESRTDEEKVMCNLYSMMKNVDAIRRLFGALNSRVGNLPSMPGIFPDYPAPIVRNAADGREIAMARWGMPSSQQR